MSYIGVGNFISIFNFLPPLHFFVTHMDD